MTPLQLPPTIRTALPEELPDNENMRQRITERKTARIVQGFTLNYNTEGNHVFKIFAEINVDNDSLWSLFRSLLVQLPDEICLLYRHIDDDPSFSVYMDKYQLLNKLEPLAFELARDGFLEFGVMYQDQDFFEEVYIKKAKYLQYWGMDETRFRQLLNDAGIYEVANLNFIDEYPLVTEPLDMHYPEVRSTEDVLIQLQDI